MQCRAWLMRWEKTKLHRIYNVFNQAWQILHTMIYCGLVWSSWQPPDRSGLFIGSYIQVLLFHISSNRQNTKKVIDCCQWMSERHFSHFPAWCRPPPPVTWACGMRGVTPHPPPGITSWHRPMTAGSPGPHQPIRGQGPGLVTNEKPHMCKDGDDWCKPRKFQTLLMKDVLRVIRNFARYALPLINL